MLPISKVIAKVFLTILGNLVKLKTSSTISTTRSSPCIMSPTLHSHEMKVEGGNEVRDPIFPSPPPHFPISPLFTLKYSFGGGGQFPIPHECELGKDNGENQMWFPPLSLPIPQSCSGVSFPQLSPPTTILG